MNFEELKSKWNWSPIHNCPSRFVWREDDKNISPSEIVGSQIKLDEFKVDKARDTVVVGRRSTASLAIYD